MGNIFVLAACTQVKVGKVASFVGKIFVVRPPTTKTMNILPHENYTLYGIIEVKPACRFWLSLQGNNYVHAGHTILTRGAWAATGYSSSLVCYLSESTYMYLDDAFTAWIAFTQQVY